MSYFKPGDGRRVRGFLQTSQEVTTMTETFQNAATKTIQVKDAKLVYRELGQRGAVPVVFLHHLTAVLDDWDPKLLDGIAKDHHVIIFDNRGVGASSGQTPASVGEMAADAIAFIEALGFAKVDLFGFSLGGFVAQVIAETRPELVRKIILAGTGPAGGAGISDVGAVLQGAFQKAGAEHKHPKHFLFFSPSVQSQKAADAFLRRLDQRQKDRDTAVSDQTVQAQITAITKWGQAPNPREALQQIRHPVLVANGDEDVMVPTVNSVALFEALPNAKLSIFPDASHGGIFEYADAFVDQTLHFLAA
jgi:pimeloyl-ACP methyl ester carboxylesterase